MNVRIPSLVGAAIGLMAALLMVSSSPLHKPPAAMTGPILPEHGGPLRCLVMQYATGAEFVWPVYRQFLGYQPPDVRVYMLCPTRQDFAEICRQIGDVKCKLLPILTGHPITAWARDRWVQLLPTGVGNAVTLLAPKGELDQYIWPQRQGDSRVAEDIAKALSPSVDFLRSRLYFDGGDFLADDRFVFVTTAVLRRNLQHTVTTREELVEQLQHDLHRPVILMDNAPDHHAGMYMMSVGNDRMLVGDPSMGASLVDSSSASLSAMEGGPDFTSKTQSRFDAVASLASTYRYHVIRIPTVPSQDGKRFLTYVNVITDVRAGRPIVYMPTYVDQPRLNRAARQVWESLGFQVFPVDCTTLWPQGGTLHCVVNVLDRGPVMNSQ